LFALEQDANAIEPPAMTGTYPLNCLRVTKVHPTFRLIVFTHCLQVDNMPLPVVADESR
jgi:hypothetical protein